MSMERLLPSRVDPRPRDDPKVYDLDDEQTQEALSALSAETARKILSTLYDQPAAPTELREEVGTSLQNVHYHLDNLKSAGLIRQVGTRYSEKGNEMAVYAPESQAVVFMAGDRESQSRLRQALSRLVGAIVLLAMGSLAFGAVVQRWLAPEGGATGTSNPPGPSAMANSPDSVRTVVHVVDSIDPALAFFLGGAFVLAVLGGWWTLRRYRTDG
ncbi:MAG: ArsR/SmtB family transcription factor [Halapricum sp.]